MEFDLASEKHYTKAVFNRRLSFKSGRDTALHALTNKKRKEKALIVTAAVGRIYFFNWLNGLSFPEGDICVFKIHSCGPDGQDRPQPLHKNKRGYKAREIKLL